MTLNDLERHNSPYFAFFSRNSTDFQADYITVVEDRPIMFVKYCLRVPVSYFFRKLYHTMQLGLSAIAEHLVYLYAYFVRFHDAINIMSLFILFYCSTSYTYRAILKYI